MLELTGEEHGDEDLLDSALDGDNRNDTKDCMRRIPKFEEPLIQSETWSWKDDG